MKKIINYIVFGLLVIAFGVVVIGLFIKSFTKI